MLAKSDVQFGLPVGRVRRLTGRGRSRLRAAIASSSPASVLIVDSDGTEDRASRDRGRGHHLARVACERDASPTRPFGEATPCSAHIDAGDRRPGRGVVDDRRASVRGRRTRRRSGRTGSRSSARDSTVRRRSRSWRAARIGRSPRSVTQGHDHARSLVGRAERVTWTAPDGLEIDGFLLAPDGDGPHPLILHVHGGPVWSYQESFPRPSLSWLVSRGLRDPDAEPARLDRPWPRVPRGRDRRHGGRRRARRSRGRRRVGRAR